MSAIKTRSRSLERAIGKNIAPNKSKSKIVRKFSALSPEQKEMEDNDSKKSKSEELIKESTNNQDENPEDPQTILKEIKAGMISMNLKMDELSKNLTQRINELTKDMHDIRTNLKSTKDKVDTYEAKQIEVCKSLSMHEMRLNIMDQKSLDTQLMISNLPKTVDTEKFMDSLITWSGNVIHTSRINSVNFNEYKGSKTAFIHFQNQGDKDKVIGHVKQQQKDTNDKYTPILCEQIMEMKEDDPGRANTIYFQTPLTPLNREIFDRAKQMKKAKCIERYWLMKGSIHIKLQNKEKPIRIDSVQQLEVLKTSIPMETE